MLKTNQLQNIEGRIVPSVFIPAAIEAIDAATTYILELDEGEKDWERAREIAAIVLCRFASALDEAFNSALFPDGQTPAGACLAEVEKRLNEADQQLEGCS